MLSVAFCICLCAAVVEIKDRTNEIENNYLYETFRSTRIARSWIERQLGNCNLQSAHVQEVIGSNPGAIYWMDIFHIDLLSKLYCLFETTKNKRKRGHLLKNTKRNDKFQRITLNEIYSIVESTSFEGGK